VAGGGKMGQHHIRAILKLGASVRVVAVADPSADSQKAVKALVPDAATYGTLDELLAREQEVDVVHVATAPHTHEALARTALEGGCHVYVEKPFVETAAAAQRLIALARSKGLKLCAGHQLLYEAPARQALELMPALGRIVHLESYFSFRTVRRMANGRVPLRADLQLLDILPHPVYLLLCFMEAAEPDERTEITAVEVGPGGTVHALVRRGQLTGTLIVTLDGRPVDSYMKLVGTNGMVHADFVRSTVQRQIGPGISGIDKVLNPYRLARQLAVGTTTSLANRILKKQRSYPGLSELFDAFYTGIKGAGELPLSEESILETVRVCERVAHVMGAAAPGEAQMPSGPRTFVTGGTGFLGKEVVKSLVQRGVPVRVLARRTPPNWEQMPGVEYVAGDLGNASLPAGALDNVDTVIHCAAETAGGWAEHQRNSLDATERVMRAAAAAGARRFIHTSSLAVLAEAKGGATLDESSPVDPQSKARGPYVWGKLESEVLAAKLATELGLEFRLVRPGPLVDWRSYDPPGRLGKRVGNIYVAVGSKKDQLAVIDVATAGRTLAWMSQHIEQAPAVLNLIAPTIPTRRELVERLRRTNPDLTVVWMPTPVLGALSLFALALQKLLRPGKPATNVAKVFASQPYDTSLMVTVAAAVERDAASARPRHAPAGQGDAAADASERDAVLV